MKQPDPKDLLGAFCEGPGLQISWKPGKPFLGRTEEHENLPFNK
jgi:hypothetical protein